MRIRFTLLALCFISTNANAQFINVFKDTDTTSNVRGIHFMSPTEGYIAFSSWIGFTEDGGNSFRKATITNNNVDFNRFLPVNLTFGFTINGVHGINRGSFFVYGHYGFVPAILFSKDEGKTFTLIFHETSRLHVENSGIQKISFPDNSRTGFAIESNNILKTNNGGESWISILRDNGARFQNLEFIDVNVGYVLDKNKLMKTNNGGASWKMIEVPPGDLKSFSFVNKDTGWLDIKNTVYQTTDGGITWEKKSKNLLGIAGAIKFVSSTAGFYQGHEKIYKTTDAGNFWEPLMQEYDYPFFHTAIFSLNHEIIWMGGRYGILDRTTNAGGQTLPEAQIDIDLSELQSSSKVKLINLSKPGNSYTWYKNATEISKEFEADYLSERNSIDTIFLIVKKGQYADTSEKRIVDTRVNTQFCHPRFTIVSDTGTVVVTAGYTAPGVKHYWFFDDGSVDSLSGPIATHHYKRIGDYLITHKVFNTIDKCTAESVQKITIYRTQNCLDADFTYTVADSFFTNQLRFQISFDTTKEHNPRAAGLAWVDWGDGTTERSLTHTFGNKTSYNVCMAIRNAFTGCVSPPICKDVIVGVEKNCDASVDIQHYNRTIVVNSKPHAGKRKHIWIINDTDTTRTDTSGYFHQTFFTERNTWGYYLQGGVGCSNEGVSVPIDSLTKKLTHIVYDEATKCADTLSQIIKIKVDHEVFIKATPNPEFSLSYTFNAFTLSSSGDTVPYYAPAWQLKGGGSDFTIEGGNYRHHQLNFTFAYGGKVRVSVPSTICKGTQYKEIYYKEIEVVAPPCPVYPPDFDFSVNPDDPLAVRFTDLTAYVNSSARNRQVWYFGDGDSLTGPLGSTIPTHVYPDYGTYTVQLQYTSPNGCTKSITKQVILTPPCRLLPTFSLTRDALNGSKIYLSNQSNIQDSTVMFIWHFGTGDSASGINSEYTYKTPGSYQITLKAIEKGICEVVKDTAIVITEEDICNIKAGFSFKLNDGQIEFINQTLPTGLSYKSYWSFGDGNTDSSNAPVHGFVTSGRYNICLRVSIDVDCMSTFCDSVDVIVPQRRSVEVFPNPPVNEITVRFSIPEGVAVPTKISVLNASGVVRWRNQILASPGQNTYPIDITGLPKGIYTVLVAASGGTVKAAKFLVR